MTTQKQKLVQEGVLMSVLFAMILLTWLYGESFMRLLVISLNH